jgi:hypothetical protein
VLHLLLHDPLQLTIFLQARSLLIVGSVVLRIPRHQIFTVTETELSSAAKHTLPSRSRLNRRSEIPNTSDQEVVTCELSLIRRFVKERPTLKAATLADQCQ